MRALNGSSVSQPFNPAAVLPRAILEGIKQHLEEEGVVPRTQGGICGVSLIASQEYCNQKTADCCGVCGHIFSIPWTQSGCLRRISKENKTLYRVRIEDHPKLGAVMTICFTDADGLRDRNEFSFPLSDPDSLDMLTDKVRTIGKEE